MYPTRSAVAGAVNDARPVSLSGTSLQTFFDGMYVSGPGINVETDQSDVAWYTNDASGGSISTLLIDAALSGSANTFGIYASGDPSLRAPIFGSQNVAGDVQLVSFLLNGDILVDGVSVATGFTPSAGFGFYLEIFDAAAASTFGDGNDSTLDYTVYTDDLLNNLVTAGGEARVLAYQGDEQTTLQVAGFQPGLFSSDTFILAFESGLPDGASRDFSDFVVFVESVVTVPEPATCLLAGVGFACVARRRRPV